MTAGNNCKPMGHQTSNPNDIGNQGSDNENEEEEEELEDESPMPTPPPSPDHLKRIEDLRRQNREMKKELEQNRHQLGDVEKIDRQMRYHTS